MEKVLSNFQGAFLKGRMVLLHFGRGAFDFMGGVIEEGKNYTKIIVWGRIRVFRVFFHFSTRRAKISIFC